MHGTAQNPCDLIDRDEIARYIHALFSLAEGVSGWVRFNAFADAADRKASAPLWVEWHGDNIDEIVAAAGKTAEYAASEPLDGYIVPVIVPALFHDASSARQDNLKTVLAVFADFDAWPEPAFAHAIAGFGSGEVFPPSFVSRSGGEWTAPDGSKQPNRHAYWLLRDPVTGKANIDRMWELQRKANVLCGSDTSATCVHPMRYAGCVRRKANGSPIKVARLESCEVLNPPELQSDDVTYTADDLARRLGQAVPFSRPQGAAGAAGSGAGSAKATKAPGSQAGPSSTGQTAAVGVTDDELRQRIIRGEHGDLHPSLRSLAYRLLADGGDEAAVIRELEDLMQQSAAKTARPADWQARFDDLPRAVATAKADQRRELLARSPDPLSAETRPQQPVPLDALPEWMRRVIDAVVRVAEVDASMALATTIGVSAIATGRAAKGVSPRAGLLHSVSLYALTISPSGERKSTVDALLSRGIRGFEHAQQDEYRRLLHDHEAARLVRQREINSALQGKADRSTKAAKVKAIGPEPQPPRDPRLLTGDATVEAMTEMLAANGGHLGILSSEGAGIFNGHSMRDPKTLLAAAARHSECWDGRSFVADRKSGGRTTVTDPAVSWSIACQPNVGRYVFGNAELIGQGLVYRLLATLPRRMAGDRALNPPDPADLDVIEDFNSWCRMLLERSYGLDAASSFDPFAGPDDPDDPVDTNGPTGGQAGGPLGLPAFSPPSHRDRVLTLTPEAQVIWLAFATEMEGEQKPGGAFADFTGWASKASEQATRLAAVMTLFDDPEAVEVDARTMTAATELIRWFAGEWLRITGTGYLPAVIEKARRLEVWLIERYGNQPFTCRGVYSAAGAGLRTRGAAMAAIKVLEAHGRVVLAETAGQRTIRGRSPATSWVLHPEIVTEAATGNQPGP